MCMTRRLWDHSATSQGYIELIADADDGEFPGWGPLDLLDDDMRSGLFWVKISVWFLA
jgi:hypothetical protein